MAFQRMAAVVAGLYCAATGCGSDSVPSDSIDPVSAAPSAGQPASGGVPGAAASTSTAAMQAAGRSGADSLPGSAATSAAGSSGATSAMGTGGAGTPASSGASGDGSPTQGDGSMAFGTDQGDYFVSGPWHGYVWTAAVGAGSTISPMDFKMQATGMPRCVKGSVAATMDYSGTASLGFNIAEDRSSVTMSVTPTKAGIQIEVANTGGSELRLQIDGAGSGPWCAPLTGSGGFVPWTSFNTMCWDGSGMAYNNEPITKISVLVPGKMDAAVAFDFCVNSLAEADGMDPGSTMQGAAGSGGAPSGAAGQGGNTTGGTTTVPPIQGGCDGYATGYWDCCKPHCGWKGNVPQGNPLAACSMSDQSLGGDYDARSACDGGNAYQCHNLAPWSINDKLAYGYAAVPASAQSDICGKCFQLQFTGGTFNPNPDPGSTALAGKTMIVQAINIGADVQNGQFDLLVPGRGVGMFDACSSQWGVSSSELGAQYGGFLLACQRQGDRNDHAAMKACVMQSCMNVFEARGLSELAAGCEWFIDWFQVADNPSLKYQQVACPSELTSMGVQRDSQATNACLR